MNQTDNQDLFMKQLQSQMRAMECPIKVDVADKVMDRIEHKSPFAKQRKTYLFRAAASVAACFLVLVSINVLRPSNDINDTLLSMNMSEIYNNLYSYDYNTNAAFTSQDYVEAFFEDMQ